VSVFHSSLLGSVPTQQVFGRPLMLVSDYCKVSPLLAERDEQVWLATSYADGDVTKWMSLLLAGAFPFGDEVRNLGTLPDSVCIIGCFG